MTRQEYTIIDAHMKSFPFDDVHDALHAYRVLYLALEIAKGMDGVDIDVLIAACLLHDIGRGAERKSAVVGHALVGAEMAETFLLGLGWEEKRVGQVREAIASHSYREQNPPDSVEAKILFDADKLDLTGAVGIARAMRYGHAIDEPLYLVDEDGMPTDAKPEEAPSLLREYNRKLKDLSGVFFTERARKIAEARQEAMVYYFEQLRRELEEDHREGRKLLLNILE